MARTEEKTTERLGTELLEKAYECELVRQRASDTVEYLEEHKDDVMPPADKSTGELLRMLVEYTEWEEARDARGEALEAYVAARAAEEQS